MRNFLRNKWILSTATVLSMGIAGCNLFHPTGSSNADNDDANALTHEGYLELQKSNFDNARKFFNKAIAADSAKSEAWMGLTKTILNSQKGLNVFELVSLAQQTEENGVTSNKFLTMSKEKADSISMGIDTVMFYLNKFIVRDTTNRTDKKIRFSDFADSYMILQLTKAALRIRAVNTQLTSVIAAGNTGMMMNLNTLNDLQDSLKPFLNDMAGAAEAIKASPETAAEIIKAYLPDSTMQYFDENDYADATVGLANTIIQLNDRAQTIDDDRTDVFFQFGNDIDDDGDGCVDEEIVDGYDNDGDGEIDEDARDYSTVVLVKNSNYITNPGSANTDQATYDLTKAQVDSLKIIDKYNNIDINMNGKMGKNDLDEWTYVIRDPNLRDEKDNHLLKFALDLNFPGKDLDEKIKNKELIRHDTDINNIKYSLKDRQKMVGGCWVYYDEGQFKNWFNGRNAK